MHDSNVSKGTPQNPVPQNQLLVQMCVETEVSFVPSTPQTLYFWLVNLPPPHTRGYHPIKETGRGPSWQKKKTTPRKFNMEPENQPLEKEIPIGNHQFEVPC